MMAGFPAKEADGHQLVNKSQEIVIYLEVGDRTPGDEVYYPDDDLIAKSTVDSGWIFTHQNGVLYDNVKAPLTARFWDYIIGWAGANIVFWNCEGDFLIQKPPTAQNYSFGHIGVNALIFNAALQDLTKPNGHVESMDRHVTPRSLYLTQLKERLGIEAVKNISKKGQD